MTLLITRLTRYGIAMAADTAVTSHAKDRPNWYTAEPNKAKKLFRIPGLQAGVSCWGTGAINGNSTSDWLERFSHSTKFKSIKIFAHRLEHALNEALRCRLNGENSIGFHVAGFEEGADSEPTFFHVHDGPSNRFPDADRFKINVHHDCKPLELNELFKEGRHQEMRNGEFRPYAIISGALQGAFRQLQSVGWPAITFASLSEVAQFNVAEIRLMSNIYSLLGKPVIGGDIHSLAIPQRGELAVEVHHNTCGAVESVEFEREDPPMSLTHFRSSEARQGPSTSFPPQTNHTAVSGWCPPKPM